MFNHLLIPFVSVGVLLFASCAKLPIDPAFAGKKVAHPGDSTTFAVIGDYGQDSRSEAEVAQMVKSWNPEFVITVGDNNYPLGSAGTIKDNIGKHYGDYIYNPDAPADRICSGNAAQAQINRFFPAPGNHDNYSMPALRPYLEYFTLPGDERNYDFVWGPVHFYSLNTRSGGSVEDVTKDWLKTQLADTTASFRLVYFHHPPYSSGNHGSSVAMQLPFSEWGADAVLAGHEHFYMRVTDSTAVKPLYLIIGNSGNENLYNCNSNPLDPNRFIINMCDNSHFGAIKVTATKARLLFEYYSTDDLLHPKDITIIYK